MLMVLGAPVELVDPELSVDPDVEPVPVPPLV